MPLSADQFGKQSVYSQLMMNDESITIFMDTSPSNYM
jgi:hypothetical protein